MLPSFVSLAIVTDTRKNATIDMKREREEGQPPAPLSLPSVQPEEVIEKRQRKMDLVVSKTSTRIGPSLGHIFNVACISAAEMIIAKVALDAVLQSKQSNTAVHENLQKSYKEYLFPVWYSLGWFASELEERYSANPDDRDIGRCHALLDLRVAYKRNIIASVAEKYVSFLFRYADERRIGRDELLSINDSQPEIDDEDDDHGQIYNPGIPPVLMEYFTRPNTYAVKHQWTDTVRALVDDGDQPCVAIVMMSFHDDPYAYGAGEYMTDIHGVTHDKPKAFRIQGIVACPIYKQLRHISVGTTFLRYFEKLSEETGRYIAVSPIGNLEWSNKLKKSPHVLLSSSTRGIRELTEISCARFTRVGSGPEASHALPTS